MTPKETFDSNGYNPNSGLQVRDWYGVGCVFFPRGVLVDTEPVFGMRVLEVIDIASHFVIHHKPIPHRPNALRAQEVIDFLTETIAAHGPPRLGIVISHSAWLSSTELEFDEDTAVQGSYLQKAEIDFPPMSYDDKMKIEYWIKSHGVRCEFNADNISDPAA